MGMRFTYPSRAANKKAETKSGGYAPKNRAAKPALRFRSRESIPDSQALAISAVTWLHQPWVLRLLRPFSWRPLWLPFQLQP